MICVDRSRSIVGTINGDGDSCRIGSTVAIVDRVVERIRCALTDRQIIERAIWIVVVRAIRIDR